MIIYYRVHGSMVSIWNDYEMSGIYAKPDAGITTDWLMGLIAGAEIFSKIKVTEIKEMK